MNVKIIAIICAFFSAAAAAAAAETDNIETYYLVHQNEALEVYDVCKTLMRDFAAEGNVNAMVKLADDQQCKAADKAVNLIAAAD